MGDVVAWGVHKMDLSREYLEGVPRLTKFVNELEAGNPPEHAARITRQVMIDYTALTPHETNYLKGVLFPFYTFYRSNIARYVPGLSDIPPKDAAMAIGRGLGVMGAATAWNELVAPTYEDNLPDWKRNGFHLFLPWGPRDGDYVLLTLQDPLNLALGQVGLAGLPQRLVGVIKGRHDLQDELREAGGQVRSGMLSPLTPLIQEPLSQLMGEDLRTGKDFTPPEASTAEKVTARVRHAASTLSPMSQMFRAQTEVGEVMSPKVIAQLAKQVAVGGLVQAGNVKDDFSARAYEAVGKARAQEAQDTHQVKVERASKLEAVLAGKPPQEVRDTFAALWSQAEGTLNGTEFQKWQAVAIEALRRRAENDRRLLPLLRAYQLKQQRVGAKGAPYFKDAFGHLTPPK